MRPADRVIATLHHEEPDMVPHHDSFGQAEAADLFFPHKRQGESTEWVLKETRWWGRDIITIGINAPNILHEILVREPGRRGYTIVKEAWGSITYTRRIPGFHKILQSPVRWPEDLDNIEPPSLDKYEPKIKTIAEEVDLYKKAGYFVEAFHNGPFVMTWHRLRGMKNLLMDLTRNQALAKKLVKFAMKNQLELTKAIIDQAEPHAIRLGNDMGTNESLFFPPRTYKEIFNPWEKRLVREYHKRGAFALHHCHGNINLILKDMVKTGIDALDPLDPHDGMNLAHIKEKHGDQITLRGGISKYIGTYSQDQIHAHIRDRIQTASPGSGYIIQSAGGLPHDMPKQNFHYYKKTLNRLRKYTSKRG